MPYGAHEHRRRSIRLREYDYRLAGAYFVTVVAQGRACLFGDVLDGVARLNEAGQCVQGWWRELTMKFPGTALDAYVVMPNHFHGIILLEANDNGPTAPHTSPNASLSASASPSLSEMVQWFKGMTTNAYIRGVKDAGWQPFAGRLWQRNYWERVIRNDAELDAIREYVANNPMQWELDAENPSGSA